MSRRITNKTDITNKDLAVQALKIAGLEHQVQGNTIHITSGALRNASIDLKSGVISGDSDYSHTEEGFGVLRQHYAEALFRSEAAKNGTTVDQREVTKDGDVILMWHTA